MADRAGQLKRGVSGLNVTYLCLIPKTTFWGTRVAQLRMATLLWASKCKACTWTAGLTGMLGCPYEQPNQVTLKDDGPGELTTY